MGTGVVYIILGLVVLICVFLLLREVVCWYWKINYQIKLQEETNELLRNILGTLREENRKTDPHAQT